MVEGEGAVWAVYKDADPIPEGCTPDLLSSPRLVTGMKAMAPLSVGGLLSKSAEGDKDLAAVCRAVHCPLRQQGAHGSAT